MPVVEGADHEGAEALRDKHLGQIAVPPVEAGVVPGRGLSDQTLAEGDGVKAQEALDGRIREGRPRNVRQIVR